MTCPITEGFASGCVPQFDSQSGASPANGPMWNLDCRRLFGPRKPEHWSRRWGSKFAGHRGLGQINACFEM